MMSVKNFRESYVFHCLVIKVVRCCSLRQLVYIITSFIVCQQLFSNFSNLFNCQKNSNGEGGIWTLAPLLTTYSLSRGAPSASLGTSPNCPTYIFLRLFLLNSQSMCNYNSLFLILSSTFFQNFSSFFFFLLCSTSGESGIRTHAPLRTNGFQDRLVMTTSISLHIMFFNIFVLFCQRMLYSIIKYLPCQ